MARIADGQLPAELAQDVEVVTRKAGLSPWHARLLTALEAIAEFYNNTPPAGAAPRRKTDA